MGRISSEPECGETKNHFSHEHPLKLINHHPQQQSLIKQSFSCSGCKLKPSGSIYSCTICPYFLHKKCFEMPKKITHPCHKNHTFTLLSIPAYPNGLFSCDACGEQGNGFSYNCKPCGVDLHILCAVMPLSVTNTLHAHRLDLTFESPYGTKSFFCDICKRNGGDHWLYRCNSCGFDAHLNCGRATAQGTMAPQQAGAGTSSRSIPQPHGGGQYGQHFQAATPHLMQQSSFGHSPMMNNVTAGIPAGAPFMPQYGTNNNDLALQMLIQQVNNNNALVQAMLAGGATGGLGGNNNRDLQQLMQLMNNGGGGGIGGGGMDVLQSLMGGGGGNGLDLLGGGGLDLGGLFGGFGF